ncbi:hypothetical protein BWD41_20865 [Citrobacter braakii]|uniref:Uncharacterized protein n=1 Tax=Citrobacter braakii TaxID=57706 RepID=A0AA44LCF1_CITBR|nr:hypothetical protein BWD41_20865 [Citrobacter braakii]
MFGGNFLMYTFFYASGNVIFAYKKARGGPAQKGMTMLLFCSNTQELLKHDMSTLKIGLSIK